MTRRSRSRSRGDRPLVRAVEVVWPVVAGVVTAVGLAGSVLQYGIVGLPLIYVGGALFTMVMVYAVFAESGARDVPVVRIGLGAAFAFVVVLGVLVVFPVYGWLIVAVAGGTSPLVTSRLAGERRLVSDSPTSATTRWVPQDQRLVDRAFQRIVASLEDDPT